MIEFKKKEIPVLLIQIAGFNDKGQMVSGLLTETISLGLKRKLQKLHNALLKHYEELQKDVEEIKKVCKEDASKDEKTEIEVLMNEDLKVDVEKISMTAIEEIKTSHNYDFDIIERIAE